MFLSAHIIIIIIISPSIMCRAFFGTSIQSVNI